MERLLIRTPPHTQPTHGGGPGGLFQPEKRKKNPPYWHQMAREVSTGLLGTDDATSKSMRA